MTIVRWRAHGVVVEATANIGDDLRTVAKTVMAPQGDACGGVCACSTCHVYVERGGELLSPADEDEEDVLDKAFDVRRTSRLGCQSKVMGEGVIELEITRESLDAFYNEHPQIKDPRKRS